MSYFSYTNKEDTFLLNTGSQLSYRVNDNIKIGARKQDNVQIQCIHRMNTLLHILLLRC